MARPVKDVPSKAIQIRAPQPFVEKAEALLATGLYGRSLPEVVLNLASAELRRVVAERVLQSDQELKEQLSPAKAKGATQSTAKR